MKGVFKNTLENVDSSVNKLVSEFLEFFVNSVEVSVENRTENGLNDFLVWSVHRENSEISLQTSVDHERTGFVVLAREEKQILQELTLF